MKFTIVQMNDTHTYLDTRQEMFWGLDAAIYRPAGGYARIATILKQIHAKSYDRILFCDCGEYCARYLRRLEDSGIGFNSNSEIIWPQHYDGTRGICLWSKKI